MPTPAAVPRPRRRAIAAALLLAALAVGAVFAWQRFVVRAPAPDVSFTLLDGSRIELAALRGRVVVVEFWATTCAICVREMPEVAALARELEPAGLTTIAVAMPYDRPDHVIAFARRSALPFAVALDPMGRVLDAFGPIPGTPTRFVVGRDGTIAARLVGGMPIDRLRNRLRDELERPAA